VTLPTEPGQGITVSEIDKPLRLTTNVAAVLGAVAVGWFLPMFGLALAAFLLVDLGVSEAKRRRARRFT
jgi:hypothetical protein